MEPYRLLMHRTNSRSRTVILYTNSKSRAEILREPRANSEIDSKPRAMNSNSNTERMDLE
jgi:hypothetical protein